MQALHASIILLSRMITLCERARGDALRAGNRPVAAEIGELLASARVERVRIERLLSSGSPKPDTTGDRTGGTESAVA